MREEISVLSIYSSTRWEQVSTLSNTEEAVYGVGSKLDVIAGTDGNCL